jgi:hypothetical protein
MSTLVSCAKSLEDAAEWKCRYIRPDMNLADANNLFGWNAEGDSGSWYWTDTRKCIVLTGHEYRIVEVYDFYRFKHYHKLLEQDGVFEVDIPTEDEQGNPINQW